MTDAEYNAEIDKLVAQVRELRARVIDLERELFAIGKQYGIDVTKILLDTKIKM